MAFASLTTNQLKVWAERINTYLTGPSETGFLLVTEFLVSSGQAALAQQGEALEQQVMIIFIELYIN